MRWGADDETKNQTRFSKAYKSSLVNLIKMVKKGQSNISIIILSILIIIVLIVLSFVLVKYFKQDKDDINRLENFTRMEQIDDSIQHNISLTNNPPTCEDECSARGLRRCFGEGYKICGNFDSDSCYEWSSISSCESDEECSSGRCRSIQQEEPVTNVPSDSSVVRYDFDEVEILSIEQFNASRIGDGPNTWADIISGDADNLEVTHAVFNLKRNGQVMKDEEEYLKVKGEDGEKRFLYNSGGGFTYLGGGLKSTKKQFWSAKQLIGDDVVKNKTPPVYSVTLWATLDEQNNLVSAKLAFSDDGLNLETRERYFDWKIVQNITEEPPESNISEIECFEEEKSGLCGPSNTIFPLGIQQEGDRIYISGPGTIFENENFKISLESPESFIAHQNYELNLSIQNKRDVVSSFKYYYIACDSSMPCARIYENLTFNNLQGAVFTDNGKDKYYSVEFASLEQKTFTISFIPKKPTLTKTPGDLDYLMFYYYPDSTSYFMDFQSWIKPGIETYEKEGQIITIQPDLTSCGGNSFPSTIGGLDGIGEGQGVSYGYYSSKCCNNIFYPNFECCNNNDCRFRDNTDGYCVDGMCMPSTKPQNRLFGIKKILVASDDFNEDEQCTTMSINSLNSYIRADIDTMERYYDHKANLLLNETTDFIDFEITQVLKLPSSFINFHDYGISEEQIINKLENMCGINTDDFDIIILPRSVTSIGGAAGFALGIGNSKIVLSTSPNAPTLIHEVGHLFGCIDLYQLSGGRLQWAHNFYGEQRTDNVNLGPVNLVELNRINEIQEGTYSVCRGHLGWIDNNKNGIIDVKEW